MSGLARSVPAAVPVQSLDPDFGHAWGRADYRNVRADRPNRGGARPFRAGWDRQHSGPFALGHPAPSLAGSQMSWRGMRCLIAGALCFMLAACGGGSDPVRDVSTAAASAELPGKQTQAYQSATKFAADGWYWNAAEPGTGFFVEAQGDQAFVGFFMYEARTGNPVWYAAYGAFFADDRGNHYFFGDLRRYANGQSISATSVPPGGSSVSLGPVSINFPFAGGAAVSLPGGRTIAATRFVFGGNGPAVQPRPHQPETGWYWNPNEGGRGYALEVQNDQLYMAMFHYNEDGSPTWHIIKGDLSTGVLTAPFTAYDGGQSLAAAFAPGGTESLRGAYTVSFRHACAGQVQRAGAPATAIRRFPIPGSGLAPAAECRVLRTLADLAPAARPPETLPDLTAAELALERPTPPLQPGDAVYGRIDLPGDADLYEIDLKAGVPYRISVKGASSSAGTLPNPRIVLYAPRGAALAVADDRGGSDPDARLLHTPATSGRYWLSVMPSSADQSGSFVLSVDGGVAVDLDASPVKPLASLAGVFAGSLRGSDTGSFSLSVGTDGLIGGSVTLASAPGAPLPVSGSVQLGGVFRLTAGALTVAGYLGPQGDLSGTWAAAGAAGGVMIGDRSGAKVLGNRPPLGSVANATTFLFGSALSLLADGSDADGDPLSYRWQLLSRPIGSSASIADPNARIATLNSDRRGLYVVALVVNDGKADGAPVHVTLTAVGSNAVPVARASASAGIISPGSVVTLDGSRSTDPDSPLSYRWEIVAQPAGTDVVAFTPEMAASPQAVFVARSAGVYAARLTVSDEQSVSSADVSITVLPPEGSPPIAQAPSTVIVGGVGASVVLKGRWAASVPVFRAWRLTQAAPGSSLPLGVIGGGETVELLPDVAGTYHLVFDVIDAADPRKVGSASAQVLAVDLSGRWAGNLGVAPLSSASIDFSTTASGALTGTLTAGFHLCGQFQRQVARFEAPLRVRYGGNVEVFQVDNGSIATLKAELSSATRMSGTLTLDIPASPSCGAQSVVLPWVATKFAAP